MGHDHHGHGHSHNHGNERAVGIAAFLTGAFMLAEVIGGVISGSLALLADAGHMLTDFASLVLAWFAFRVARRPADWKRTYGFDRLSVLAAFVNGISLIALTIWITVEAISRLLSPHQVEGGILMGVAIAGLIVNLLSFWVLSRGDKENLNLRAATLHVMGDLLGSVAAIVAGIVILTTGWMPIDPILSLLVAALILRSAIRVTRESGHILLEAAPHRLDIRTIRSDLTENIEGVSDIQHLHAWSISENRAMLTLEAHIEAGTDPDTTRRAIKARLHQEFDIDHATVETMCTPSQQ
jgi:cobalt-zinc-cadmium efflux system protein